MDLNFLPINTSPGKTPFSSGDDRYASNPKYGSSFFLHDRFDRLDNTLCGSVGLWVPRRTGDIIKGVPSCKLAEFFRGILRPIVKSEKLRDSMTRKVGFHVFYHLARA